jgi:uncharacterized protein YcnI
MMYDTEREEMRRDGYPMTSCRDRRYLIFLIGIVLATSTLNAWAHIDIEPKETIPSRWETFTVNVPTETESPTVAVQLDIPQGFEVEAIEHRADWNMALRRDDRGFVREVVWSNGQIPPLTFAEFKLLTKAAKSPGTYDWQARQRYADGQESTWAMRTIVRAEGSGLPSQKAEEALKMAQTAMTISFMAIGIATVLIAVTLIAIWRGSQRKGRGTE